MRFWNGIVTGDVVEYNSMRYLVTKIYKQDGKGVLDLHAPEGDLIGILAYDCKKVM